MTTHGNSGLEVIDLYTGETIFNLTTLEKYQTWLQSTYTNHLTSTEHSHTYGDTSATNKLPEMVQVPQVQPKLITLLSLD